MSYCWPNLRDQCLLCGIAGCRANYRGYYRRILFCPEMEFLGSLVIRTAYCPSQRVRYSLSPDFTLLRVKVSRISLIQFLQIFARLLGNLSAAIDEWTQDLGEEFYVPLSTARFWISQKIPVPP
jgi:hypothetical protein